MNELETIRYHFSFDEFNQPKLENYGQYTHGLTSEEIDDYLRVRARKLNVKTLRKKFEDIAGVNTVAVHICPSCGKQIYLMYRHDVKRFADKLFLNKETYWD